MVKIRFIIFFPIKNDTNKVRKNIYYKWWMVGDRYFYSVFDECSLYFRPFFVQIIGCEFLQVKYFATCSIPSIIWCKFSDLNIFSNTCDMFRRLSWLGSRRMLSSPQPCVTPNCVTLNRSSNWCTVTHWWKWPAWSLIMIIHSLVRSPNGARTGYV